MTISSYKFNPRIKDYCRCTECPPETAIEADVDVFRGIRQAPITSNDFLSHAELNLPNAKVTNCEHWGLSVWLKIEDVVHARRAYRPLKGWSVAKGRVKPDDGVLLATPSRQQPQHYTFWKVFGRDLIERFEIVLSPNQ